MRKKSPRSTSTKAAISTDIAVEEASPSIKVAVVETKTKRKKVVKVAVADDDDDVVTKMDIEVQDDDDSDDDDIGGDEDEDDEEEDDHTGEKQPSKPNKSTAITTKKGRDRHPRESSAVVIYIGHLPSVFGEYELLTFLKQFGGTITHVRVSRSVKTGNSRGYAFVRILESDVATAIVSTLSGYLLLSQKAVGMNKRFVCHIVPSEKVHARLFIKHTCAIAMAKARKERKLQPPKKKSLSKITSVQEKLIQQERQKRIKIQNAGMEYDFPGYENKTATTNDANNKHEEREIATTESIDDYKDIAATDSSSTKKDKKTTTTKTNKRKSTDSVKSKNDDDNEPTATTTKNKNNNSKDDEPMSTVAAVATPTNKKNKKTTQSASASKIITTTTATTADNATRNKNKKMKRNSN